MAEIELFASALAPFGIKPIFFSGCPVACRQAAAVIDNISCYPIDKTMGDDNFNRSQWRAGLAESVVESLDNDQPPPYQPNGPMQARLTLRDGEATAQKIADRWKIERNRNQIFLSAPSRQALYLELIRICYLTPLVEKTLPVCLLAYNLWGRIGLSWVRRQIRKSKPFKGSGFKVQG